MFSFLARCGQLWGVGWAGGRPTGMPAGTHARTAGPKADGWVELADLTPYPILLQLQKHAAWNLIWNQIKTSKIGTWELLGSSKPTEPSVTMRDVSLWRGGGGGD